MLMRMQWLCKTSCQDGVHPHLWQIWHRAEAQSLHDTQDSSDQLPAATSDANMTRHSSLKHLTGQANPRPRVPFEAASVRHDAATSNATTARRSKLSTLQAKPW